MCSTLPSTTSRPRRRQAGFTLIELMIGVVIGMLATVAVTFVLVNSEGNKRATTSGSDAQVNGALALATLQRVVQSAGYGFAAVPDIVGCPLTASYNGAAIAGFPANLVPVVITNGASDAPDTIRILASGKPNFSVPLRIVPPGYDPANTLANKYITVNATAGISAPRKSGGTVVDMGDLMVAAKDATSNCEVFEMREDPGTLPRVPVVDSSSNRGKWNAAGYPAGVYVDGNFVISLGQPVDVTYSIQNNALAATTLKFGGAPNFAPSYDGPVEAFPDIVNLQALYGKDTSVPADGTIDQWDNATPTTNAGWKQVLAVRIAVVARSGQYEKDEVTAGDLQWDLGKTAAAAVPDGTDCSGNRCIKLKVSHLTDYKHYRYRVFDTIVPLRNMLWNS